MNPTTLLDQLRRRKCGQRVDLALLVRVALGNYRLSISFSMVDVGMAEWAAEWVVSSQDQCRGAGVNATPTSTS